MAHRVIWSPRAVADVEAIASYIAADSTTYANTVVRRIIRLASSLENFPRSDRKVPEFDNENIRELFAYSYRIMYHIEEGRVTIAAVIHGRRML